MHFKSIFDFQHDTERDCRPFYVPAVDVGANAKPPSIEARPQLGGTRKRVQSFCVALREDGRTDVQSRGTFGPTFSFRGKQIYNVGD